MTSLNISWKGAKEHFGKRHGRHGEKARKRKYKVTQRPELKVSWDKMADMEGRYFAFFWHSEIIVNGTEINCQVLEGSLAENKEKAEFLSQKVDMSHEKLTQTINKIRLYEINRFEQIQKKCHWNKASPTG